MLNLIANVVLKSLDGGNVGGVGFAVFCIMLVLMLVELVRVSLKKKRL